MNSLTITPNSDDSQADDEGHKRPASAVTEALVSLVERAKNLNFDIRSQSLNLTRSCPIISRCTSLAVASMSSSTTTTTTTTTNTVSIKKQSNGSGRMLPIRSKARGFAGGNGRSVAVPPITTTLRKLRKIDAQLGQGSISSALQAQPPPPPPPSPRSPQSREIGLAVKLADALKDEYKHTELLTNHIFQEAVSINEELTQQWQHQRDLELVHQIEIAAESHGLNLLLAEKELTELKSRCFKALDQQVPLCSVVPVINPNQGTQTIDDNSSVWPKDSQLGNAISKMHELMVIGVEDESTAPTKSLAESSELTSFLTEFKERLLEIRHLMGLKAQGSSCEDRLREIRFQCQRNAAFYQEMIKLENELSQMLPAYSSLAPEPVQYTDKTIESKIPLHEK